MSKAEPSKDAVIFVVDANLTMLAPYPAEQQNDTTANSAEGDSSNDIKPPPEQSTRLSQAKDAVLTSIIDLMWRSKTHETGVVVLKSGVTHHHLSELDRITDDVDVGKFFRRCAGGNKLHKYETEESDVFPNLVEFELNRPSPHTLRAIKNISCTINDTIASSVQGDLCDGLILAADALHRRTSGKKYGRKIVMITDAEHEVEVNGEQLQCVLDGLNKMEVDLIVVGIGFEEVTVPIKAEEEDSDSEDIVEINESDNNDEDDRKPEAVKSAEKNDEDDTMVKEEGNPDETMVDETKQETYNNRNMLIKRENEKLLFSIAQATGGFILAANGRNLSDVLQTKLPCLAGKTKYTMRHTTFRIAPNISLPARSAYLAVKKNIPTTLKEAYEYDEETGKPLRDGNGELMTLPTKTDTRHYDDEGNEVPYGEF